MVERDDRKTGRELKIHKLGYQKKDQENTLWHKNGVTLASSISINVTNGKLKCFQMNHKCKNAKKIINYKKIKWEPKSQNENANNVVAQTKSSKKFIQRSEDVKEFFVLVQAKSSTTMAQPQTKCHAMQN